MRNLLLRATALAFSIGLVPPAASQPALQQPAPIVPAELTADQWREDLRFMAAEMERRHSNLYHSVSREAFAAAVADLEARIPRLRRNEIIVGMMRIAAMVGDGHTRVDPRKDAKFAFPSLPLKLYLFEDGLYVRAAAPSHAGLVGARIEAIGGVPVKEAMRRAAEISSRDNAIGPRLFIPLYLNMPAILHALGLSKGPGEAVLHLTRDGRRWTEKVAAGEVEPLWPPDTDISLGTPAGWIDARAAPEPPLWLQAPLDYHRMIDLPERRALYVQLNMVTGTREQTLEAFATRIGERVRSTNPRALVLDLRLNLGGNGDLIPPLVRELIKAEDEDTRLFVLTWRGTFSASQFILDDLDRLSDAVFIGEPASSKPSSFGDSYREPLPNSGISVRSSIVWWQDRQNWSPWTWIDVAAPLTFADYVAGRDPALEAALAFVPPVPLDEQLAAAAEKGPAGVRQALDAWRADPVNRYGDFEGRALQATIKLLAAGHQGEAFAAAEHVARQLPDSVDAFVILAHVAEKTGRADAARAAGERAIVLDPNNRAARSLIERLPRK